MPITNWPINERPREKLLQRGPTSLSDAELLAIFLRTGVRNKTAVDLARELLSEFGGLRQLLSADQTDFCRARGLGPAKYALLQAALELGRRHLRQAIERTVTLSSPEDTQRFLLAHLRDYSREVFACLFLDNRHRVIKYSELFQGTINVANVYPREVVSEALRCQAAAVIFAHNHPSGVAEPSPADVDLTSRLKAALQLVDIRVLDHFIVGDRQAVSLAARGLV